MNAVRLTALLVLCGPLVVGCAGLEVTQKYEAPPIAEGSALATEGPALPGPQEALATEGSALPNPKPALPGPEPSPPSEAAEAGGLAVQAPAPAAVAVALPEPEPPLSATVSPPLPFVLGPAVGPLPAEGPALPGPKQALQTPTPALPGPEPPRAVPARTAASAASAPAAPAPARAVAPAAPPPAPQAVASAPATATAPAPKPAAAPAAGSTAAERRQAFARRGDDVQVALPGTGWVFSGTSEPSVAEFKSRITDRGGTVFSFRTQAAGKAVLSFQRQDGAGGSARGAAVELSVIGPEEFASRVEKGETTPELPNERRSFVDRLIEARQYEDALREMAGMGEADAAYRNDRTGVILSAKGDLRGARAAWQRNAPKDEASPVDDMQARALSGLLRMAVLLDDYSAVLKGLGPLRRGLLPGPEIEGQSLVVAAYLLGKPNAAAAIGVLEDLAARGERGKRLDEMYMLLARAYETEGPLRDVGRAQGLYRRVYEAFPESSLAETARDRARYLERHILLVQ